MYSGGETVIKILITANIIMIIGYLFLLSLLGKALGINFEEIKKTVQGNS